MNGELTSTEAVMKALGGYRGVAKITGAKPTATHNWKKFETFPPDTYLVLIKALKAKGLSAPASLWRMREPVAAE